MLRERGVEAETLLKYLNMNWMNGLILKGVNMELKYLEYLVKFIRETVKNANAKGVVIELVVLIQLLLRI